MNFIKNIFSKLFDYKKPIIKENTFIVWEPCSKSHSEVVPGFAKILADLGYHVSIIVHKDRLKEGLFSYINEANFSYNFMSKREIETYFKKDDLASVKGVMVTTVGKISDCIHYEQCFNHFNPKTDKRKLFFVEHDIKKAVDNNTDVSEIITLRKMDYKGVQTTVVNPHYFGEIEIKPKNKITNFITIGHIAPHKKNTNEMLEAALKLIDEGITDFKITVIGRGDIKNLPLELRKYVDIKGRLSYKEMYDELIKADFLLTAYNKEHHSRYITTGASGNIQLVYGFLKPCIIADSFAEINGFNENNAVIYKENTNLKEAMEKSIKMNKEEYSILQNNLKLLKDEIYNQSKENFKNLILKRELSLPNKLEG